MKKAYLHLVIGLIAIVLNYFFGITHYMHDTVHSFTFVLLIVFIFIQFSVWITYKKMKALQGVAIAAISLLLINYIAFGVGYNNFYIYLITASLLHFVFRWIHYSFKEGY